ncbi:MAG: hypothetical protein ACKERG_00820 [Candidatus Hodgkinia cicadicola]
MFSAKAAGGYAKLSTVVFGKDFKDWNSAWLPVLKSDVLSLALLRWEDAVIEAIAWLLSEVKSYTDWGLVALLRVVGSWMLFEFLPDTTVWGMLRVRKMMCSW